MGCLLWVFWWKRSCYKGVLLYLQSGKNKNTCNWSSYFRIFMAKSWWHHQMENLSTELAIGAENSPVTSEFPTQRPVTRSFDVFLLCAWLNGWVNNCEAGDLRCHHAHYDVSVMYNQSAAVHSSSTYYLHPKFNTRQLFIAICLKIVLNISNLPNIFYQYDR